MQAAKPLFDYPKADKLVDHVVRFSLRGIGLTEAAIAKHFDQNRLKALLVGAYEEGPIPSAKPGKRS